MQGVRCVLVLGGSWHVVQVLLEHADDSLQQSVRVLLEEEEFGLPHGRCRKKNSIPQARCGS